MEYKQLFQRMELDKDVRSLQPGEYRKLTNGITVPPASSSYENALRGVLHSLFGNAIVSYSLPSGTNQCIGYLEDRAGNRGFFFVYNTTAENRSIYQFKDGVITLVFRSALLDFAATDFINADIIGNILIFTNRRTETIKLDVLKAIAGDYSSAIFEGITLIKRPPQLHLTRAMIFDNDRVTNFIGKNYYQFYYRYIYENDEYSVLSAASADRESYGLFGIGTTNEVTVAADTNQTLSGTGAVIDGITLVATNRVFCFAQTDQKENGVWVVGAGAWTRATDADTGAELNDLYVVVKRGLKYIRKVFRNTNTSAITIGVTNITFSPTEGPNAIDITINASEVIPGTVKAIEWIVRVDGSNEYTVYRIEKTPIASRTHRFYNDTFLYTVPDTETSKWNESIPLVSKSLRIFENRLFLFNNTEGEVFETDEVVTATINITGFPVGRYILSQPKRGGRYSAGIVYFDNYGRLSSPTSITTFEVPTNRSSQGFITSGRIEVAIGLSGITNIPDWATHYSVVVTEELDRSYFLQGETADAYYYTKTTAGVYTYSKAYAIGSVGMAFDLRTLTNLGLGYTWSEGDRIKFFSAGNREDTFVDLKILGQEGSFILTEPNPLFSLNTGTATGIPFEIYTPRKSTVQSFFEIGNRYPITSPGPSASLSTTSVNFLGDTFIIYRTTYSAAGSYSNTDPSTNSYEVFSASYFEAMNYSDDNFSVWVKPGGKSLIKSTSDDIQSTKRSSIRWSQQYVLESNINGLNVFNALDEQNLPAENGTGVILAEKGKVLSAIFETETVSLYIGEGFVNTTDGNQFLAKTESVIGDDNKLLGGHGTTVPASLVSRNGKIYFLDTRKGVVVRNSQDGLTVISDYGVRGLVSKLCTTHKALGANSRIIAGWDPQYDCYTISFIDITSTPTGITLYYHEKSNSWVCQTDERPEFWGILEQQKIFFNAGALYLQSIEANYNNWGGVQYNRRLEFEISPMQSLVHLWDALEVDVASIYSTAGTNEDVVLLYHENGGILQTRINYLDFQLKERVYRSAFFRSLNDINFQNTTESKYKSPDQIRGQSAFMVITYNGTDKNVMKSITVFYTPSMNSNP